MSKQKSGKLVSLSKQITVDRLGIVLLNVCINFHDSGKSLETKENRKYLVSVCLHTDGINYKCWQCSFL